MGKDILNRIDTRYVNKCLEANRHNALTAFYYLLLKKKVILGGVLDDDEVEENASVPLMPKDR